MHTTLGLLVLAASFYATSTQSDLELRSDLEAINPDRQNDVVYYQSDYQGSYEPTVSPKLYNWDWDSSLEPTSASLESEEYLPAGIHRMPRHKKGWGKKHKKHCKKHHKKHKKHHKKHKKHHKKGGWGWRSSLEEELSSEREGRGHKKKGKKKGCGIHGGWWYIYDKKHGYLSGRWGHPPPHGLEREHYWHGFGKLHNPHHKSVPWNKHGHHGHHGGHHGHHGGHHGHHGGWGWQPKHHDLGWGHAQLQHKGWGWR